jgi:tRNA-(ms[2]io[6]A)-hydroxylase
MVSEAGHYKNFLHLAKKYFPEEQVNDRWRDVLSLEAEVIKSLHVRGDRLH